jgi:2-phosphosulfolactate phosphatase
VTTEEQAGFDPRLAWGVEGTTELAPACPVLVVVDVLRFTTAVEVVVARGARVALRPWPDATPRAGFGPGSLSPAALGRVAPGTLVELASPNGATVTLAAAGAGAGADGHRGPSVQGGTAGAGAVVLAGCLRNASAVAVAARRLGGPVGVVAAGERRPDGTLRPAVEDLLGAGAILHALGGRPSPEARAAVAAFLDAAADLPAILAACTSGRELAGGGLAADLPLAAEHDVSRAVPVLRDGAFGQLSWPG